MIPFVVQFEVSTNRKQVLQGQSHSNTFTRLRHVFSILVHLYKVNQIAAGHRAVRSYGHSTSDSRVADKSESSQSPQPSTFPHS